MTAQPEGETFLSQVTIIATAVATHPTDPPCDDDVAGSSDEE